MGGTKEVVGSFKEPWVTRCTTSAQPSLPPENNKAAPCVLQGRSHHRSLNPMNPMNPLNPVNPINPVNPANPTNPINP